MTQLITARFMIMMMMLMKTKKMMMINVRSEVGAPGGGWKDDLDVSNPFHQPIAAFRPSEI